MLNYKYLDPDDKFCPIRSLRINKEHSNPDNPFLWQYHLDKINPNKPDVWYNPQHMGWNICSKSAKLVLFSDFLRFVLITRSRISVVTRESTTKFKITSHSSIQTLANYLHTQDKTKIKVGKYCRVRHVLHMLHTYAPP